MESTSSAVYINSKSMYDVIVENLDRQKKKTYIHRIVYAFEYETLKSGLELGEQFEEIINYQNSTYSDEPVTGVLALYSESNIGIHMIEGSDYTLSRHAELLYREGKIKSWISGAKVKLLVAVFHVADRLQKRWSYVYLPPLPIKGPVKELMEEEEEDLCEMYHMFVQIIAEPHSVLCFNQKHKSDEDSDSSQESFVTELSDEEVPHENDQVTAPPPELVSILLNSELLQDFEHFSNKHKALPTFVPYHETIWPLPTSHIPEYSEVVLTAEQHFEPVQATVTEKE